MKINIKEIKKIALEPELNKIAQKYPKNIEIAIGKKPEFVIINASNDEGNDKSRCR